MVDIHYFRSGKQNQRKIALTFDDGPTPGITEKVAETLESFGVRGTFFVIGRWVAEAASRATIQRLLDGGHIVGNHSNYHFHPNSVMSYPPNEFNDAEGIISEVCGQPTQYARAPYVCYRRAVCASLKNWLEIETKRKIIDVDVWGFDWDMSLTSQDIINNILANPRTLEGVPHPLDSGAIVCLHDGSEQQDRFTRPTRMLNALPAIIHGLQTRDFELVSVDELALRDEEAIAFHCT